MKNIDFLPESYNHRRALRHARHCWLGVGILFGLLISVAASGQWILRRTLESQVRSIEQQYAIAQQRQAEMQQLKQAEKLIEERAALYSYLEYPWPKTQLLAAIAQPLPASVQLISLRILEQSEAARAVPRPDGDTNHSAGEGEKPKEITPQSVLADLRREHDPRRTILELSGETDSAKDLHEYVEALAKSPLFTSASLKGLELVKESSAKKVSKFEIRVMVVPGYGQPGAPAKKAAATHVAVSGTAENSVANNPGGLP